MKVKSGYWGFFIFLSSLSVVKGEKVAAPPNGGKHRLTPISKSASGRAQGAGLRERPLAASSARDSLQRPFGPPFPHRTVDEIGLQDRNSMAFFA